MHRFLDSMGVGVGVGCEEALQAHLRTFGSFLPPGQPAQSTGLLQQTTPGRVLPSSLMPTLGLHLQTCLYRVGKAIFQPTQLLDINSR